MSESSKTGDKGGNGREAEFVVVDKRPSFQGDAAAPEPRYPTVVEQLKTRAEEAERRARDISGAYRRIEEERDAFRERLARDLERRVDQARAEMMRKVIDVLDDLDRAIASARAGSSGASLLPGVVLIRDRLLQVLASEGVEALRTEGLPFDPAVAEAVATEPTDDPARHDIVLEEMEKGYALRGTLLRPARVRVGRIARRDSGEHDALQSEVPPPRSITDRSPAE